MVASGVSGACDGFAVSGGGVPEFGDGPAVRAGGQQPAGLALGLRQRKHARRESDCGSSAPRRRFQPVGAHSPGKPLHFLQIGLVWPVGKARMVAHNTGGLARRDALHLYSGSEPHAGDLRIGGSGYDRGGRKFRPGPLSGGIADSEVSSRRSKFETRKAIPWRTTTNSITSMPRRTPSRATLTALSTR